MTNKDTGFDTVTIKMGGFYVTDKDECISTTLGSCVAACIRDRISGVGGMNHFMLPLSNNDEKNGHIGLATRYGNYAMEQLINEILKNGGSRENLEVKVFGGGKVLSNMHLMNIGSRNIDFVKEYIETEGLRLAAQDLGDMFPRKVYYHPLTGKVRMKKLRSMHNNTILDREENYMKKITKQPDSGNIELF